MDIMKCYCHPPLIMSTSHSEKNPERLFLNFQSVGALSDESRVREPQYSEKMRNGTPEERERERVHQELRI